MTKDKIRKVAVSHFARNGYDGASLNDIAAEVGIKKPSIYSHYKNKEDLFLQCVHEVLAEEHAFVQSFFKTHTDNSLLDNLYNYLLVNAERAETNFETMFWIRSIYFPPKELEKSCIAIGDEFLMQLRIFFASLFKEDTTYKEDPMELAEAFLCLFDGCIIELFYGNKERFIYRLNASFKVYAKGITS